jgi:hypothetical protein
MLLEAALQVTVELVTFSMHVEKAAVQQIWNSSRQRDPSPQTKARMPIQVIGAFGPPGHSRQRRPRVTIRWQVARFALIIEKNHRGDGAEMDLRVNSLMVSFHLTTGWMSDGRES